MVHLPLGVFGIEVSAQAALQDGTVVAELTVQIPSVSSFCIIQAPYTSFYIHCSTHYPLDILYSCRIRYSVPHWK